MNIQLMRQKIEQKKGARNQIKSDLINLVEKRKQIDIDIEHSQKAQEIIQAVAALTQSELQYRITEPTSLALKAVYHDNPYSMAADFKITGRGTTECHLAFERNGNLVKPLEASGGGPIDVASFALRVGSWSLTQPRSRPVLILDEPFRFVSRDKMPLAGQMLKEVSEQLGLQIIMISHISELIECGDRIIEVSIKDEVSSIEYKEN